MPARLPDPLPHEYPFRLVERAGAIDGNRIAVVLGTADGSTTPAGEWPVTLVAEALAQAILLVVAPARIGELRLVALDKVRLLQPLRPGVRLEIDVEESAVFGSLRRYACRAHCGGALAAAAEITVSG